VSGTLPHRWNSGPTVSAIAGKATAERDTPTFMVERRVDYIVLKANCGWVDTLARNRADSKESQLREWANVVRPRTTPCATRYPRDAGWYSPPPDPRTPARYARGNSVLRRRIAGRAGRISDKLGQSCRFFSSSVSCACSTTSFERCIFSSVISYVGPCPLIAGLPFHVAIVLLIMWRLALASFLPYKSSAVVGDVTGNTGARIIERPVWRQGSREGRSQEKSGSKLRCKIQQPLSVHG
jgi:hypothetical protein